MIGYRIPPKSKNTKFLIGRKNRDQPVNRVDLFAVLMSQLILVVGPVVTSFTTKEMFVSLVSIINSSSHFILIEAGWKEFGFEVIKRFFHIDASLTQPASLGKYTFCPVSILIVIRELTPPDIKNVDYLVISQSASHPIHLCNKAFRCQERFIWLSSTVAA